MDARAERQLRTLTSGVSGALGPELVGAYLFGSAVVGGLKPRSDIDVLAVTRRETTRDEKRRLVDLLLAVSRTPRHVELTIVVQSHIKPWTYPPVRDFQYGDWWRAEFEAGQLAPWASPTDPDVASLITMVLDAGRPLVGPPPAVVFDPVPRGDYLRAMRRGVDDVLRDVDGDTRNVVLTLARIWYSVATGGVQSKDRAADWALERLPPHHREVLARARAIYVGDEEDRWTDVLRAVHAYADHVAAEIDELLPRE